MRQIIILAAALILAGASQADIIYLNAGEAISGVITRMDSAEIEIALPDGQTRVFPAGEVFQATDDAGAIIFPLPGMAAPVVIQPSPGVASTIRGPGNLQSALSGGYRRIYHFPFWPVLGGTALLGYVGISQLTQSSDTYQESVERENNGLEFNTLRNRSLKQRTWGQIALAGAVACLVVGLTPKIEKVPLQQALKVIPTKNGLTLCLNL
jgi:outer membrane lipoprotein SlyB